ncbi:hypothetical protein Pcinc_040568 [Petrolisthes cinctipes]|uniref:Uncharacterized protein n=1 Tax=Petrolisthes cinctipes TaxID=88211 RepID=A0AAE1BL75_PETCI|nr:hypothetical protein Pcinc_040568 [Petrolisthes cinctipes]
MDSCWIQVEGSSKLALGEIYVSCLVSVFSTPTTFPHVSYPFPPTSPLLYLPPSIPTPSPLFHLLHHHHCFTSYIITTVSPPPPSLLFHLLHHHFCFTSFTITSVSPPTPSLLFHLPHHHLCFTSSHFSIVINFATPSF